MGKVLESLIDMAAPAAQPEALYMPKTRIRKRDGETVAAFHAIDVSKVPAPLRAALEKRDELVAALVEITKVTTAGLEALAPRLANNGRRILHPGDVPDVSYRYDKVSIASVSPNAKRTRQSRDLATLLD